MREEELTVSQAVPCSMMTLEASPVQKKCSLREGSLPRASYILATSVTRRSWPPLPTGPWRPDRRDTLAQWRTSAEISPDTPSTGLDRSSEH